MQLGSGTWMQQQGIKKSQACRYKYTDTYIQNNWGQVGCVCSDRATLPALEPGLSICSLWTAQGEG